MEKSEKIIGVLGCGGIVGKTAVQHLVNEYKVRGGQRREPKELSVYNNFAWVPTDLYDEESLDHFCKGCSIILNCAGPLYKIKDTVAKAAAKNNAIYVDVGDLICSDVNIKNNLPQTGIYIVGTGFYPGLSGYLLKRLLSENCIKATKVFGYVGGREEYSNVAFADILMSSMMNIGHPDGCLNHGELEKEVLDISEKLQLPGFKEEVYAKAYLGEELLHIATQFPMDELHWYNTLTDFKNLSAVSKFYKCAKKNGIDAAIQTVGQLQQKLTAPAWSSIVFEIHGEMTERPTHLRCQLEVTNSSIITGQVAALTVLEALKCKLAPGIYWASDIVKEDMISRLEQNPAFERFHVEEVR